MQNNELIKIDDQKSIQRVLLYHIISINDAY